MIKGHDDYLGPCHLEENVSEVQWRCPLTGHLQDMFSSDFLFSAGKTDDSEGWRSLFVRYASVGSVGVHVNGVHKYVMMAFMDDKSARS